MYPYWKTSFLYLFSFLMVQLLSNIIEEFSDNADYTQKVIYMWYQVC